MKWKKLVSLLIVSVFIFSALAVVNSPAKAQGEYVDQITVEVRTDRTTALGEVATGGLDVFLQPVEGQVYDGLDEAWKEQMDTWRSSGAYNSQYYNPAHTVSPYECDVEGQLQFNPFAIKKCRQAQHYLINRDKIVNELYKGFAEPRYFWMANSAPAFEEYYAPLVDEFGFTPQGDREKGADMFEEGMKSAMNDPELQGELQQGDDGFWEYKPPGGSFSDIEVTGIIRIEDTRLQVGEYQADLLRDHCGLKVEEKKMDRSSYAAIVWSSDPANLQWNFYTGGWIAGAASYYQEVNPAQMHSGWYGFMPGGFVPDADYRYTNESLDEITQALYNGWVNSLDQYWEWMVDATRLGTEEAVRVFICTTFDMFAYDKDRVTSAATDILVGWSDVFSPRTLKTPDGTATLAQYSSQGTLYMDNWNELGGSSDMYGLQQKRMLVDYGYNMNPGNGRPIPGRIDWTNEEGEAMVEKDFEWVTNETGARVLERNLDVPADAIKYNTDANEWQEVGDGVKAATKVTYRIHEGKWHSGADLTMRDVMAWHAWSMEMTYQDGEDDQYYHEGYGGQMKPTYDNIKGEKWNPEEGTWTVWGDYTLPVDSKVGGYYCGGQFPVVPYYLYEAAQQLVMQNEDLIPSGVGTYGWDSAGVDNWIHWLSEKQGGHFTTVLQNMIDANWMPDYLKEENGAPMTVSQDQLNSEMSQLIEFYDEHKHVFASQGPFMADTINAENLYVDFVRFSQEDGYPFAEDYFTHLVRIAELTVTSSNVPGTVTAPDALEVSFGCQIDEDYPNDETRDVTGDDDASVTIKLLDSDGNVVQTVDSPTLTDSAFEATFDTEGLTSGQYTVQFSGVIPEMVGAVTESVTVIIQGAEGGLSIKNFEVSPTTVAPGDSVTITATAENTGDSAETVDVMVDGTSINSYDVPAGESVEIEETYTFDTAGSYEVEIGDKTATVSVVSPNLEVSELDVPASTIVGKTVTISADVENTGDAELSASIMVDGSAEKDFTLAAGESKTVTLDYTFDSAGTYTVSVGDMSKDIEVKEKLVIEDASVAKSEVTKGKKVEISAEITNNDDTAHEVEVKVGGETVHTFSVSPGTDTYTYEHKFNTKGDMDVEVGGESAGTVKVKAEEPGFTMVILGISAIAAVALYYKRRK